MITNSKDDLFPNTFSSCQLELIFLGFGEIVDSFRITVLFEVFVASFVAPGNQCPYFFLDVASRRHRPVFNLFENCNDEVFIRKVPFQVCTLDIAIIPQYITDVNQFLHILVPSVPHLKRQSAQHKERCEKDLFDYHFMIHDLILDDKIIKLMDPRPYHYEFRRPRLSNPTQYIHSGHAYQGIYHVGSYEKMRNEDKIISSQLPRWQEEQQAMKNYNIQEYPYDMPKPQKNNEQFQARNENRSQYEGVRKNSGAGNEDRGNEQKSNNYNHETEKFYQNEASQPKGNKAYQARQNQYSPRGFQVKEPQRSSSQDSPTMPRKDSGYMSAYGSQVLRGMPGKDQDKVYERQQKAYNIITCYPNEQPTIHRKFPKYTLEHRLIETGRYNNPEGY